MYTVKHVSTRKHTRMHTHIKAYTIHWCKQRSKAKLMSVNPIHFLCYQSIYTNGIKWIKYKYLSLAIYTCTSTYCIYNLSFEQERFHVVLLPLHFVDFGLCLRNIWITKWNKWLDSKISQPKNVEQRWLAVAPYLYHHHHRSCSQNWHHIYMNIEHSIKDQKEWRWVNERKILNRVNLSRGIHT